ncbi:hypothetical protein F5050DRAFT_1582343, partial [Lentinula boryana]
GIGSSRSCTVKAALYSVVRNNASLTHASQIAAEAAGFAVEWGSHLVRRWLCDWVESRILPALSNRGRHCKVNSILSDPIAREAIHTYLRSNKWSLNPQKLKCLMKGEMASQEADEYVHELEHNEMPQELKAFLEETLLPCLHVKSASSYGLSLSSMHHLMLREGWVLNGEQPLQKKGPSRGIHQSDFICSTVGWLKDASATLEYGKNHQGMWTGELSLRGLYLFPTVKRLIIC